MSPEIIENILALLERVQLSGKEVPVFNRAVSALIQEREHIIKEMTPTA